MAVIDKSGKLAALSSGKQTVVLELGCGAHKKHHEAIGIDAIDYDGVDIVGDVHDVLSRIPEKSVSAVYSYHFFEHVEDIERLMEGLAHVLKPEGRLVIAVPHFSNPYYYSDYTHKRPFGLYSLSYLSEDNLFARKVPHYSKRIFYQLTAVNLYFKSPRPFYIRWALKRMVQMLVNINRFTLEFYEENLCYLIPCYEVKYELLRLQDQ